MSKKSSIDLELMGLRIPSALAHAIRVRAVAEKKNNSEWAIAVFENALGGAAAVAQPTGPNTHELLTRIFDRLDSIERRLAGAPAEEEKPEGFIPPSNLEELKAALKARALDKLTRCGKTRHYDLQKHLTRLRILRELSDEYAAFEGVDPKQAVIEELLSSGAIKSVPTFKGASYVLGTPAAAAVAPQSKTKGAAPVDDLLFSVFSALSHALGDADVEIRLSQPLATTVIDIWIPAAALALTLEEKHKAMTGAALSAYHAELAAFHPNVTALPVSLANVGEIAERVLQSTPKAKEITPNNDRHAKVIALLEKGLTQKQVAARLGYHVATVEKISQRHRKGAAIQGMSFQERIQALITSPAFSLRYRGKEFKARVVVDLLAIEPNRANLAIVSNDLRRLCDSGLLKYTRRSRQKSGSYRIL